MLNCGFLVLFVLFILKLTNAKSNEVLVGFITWQSRSKSKSKSQFLSLSLSIQDETEIEEKKRLLLLLRRRLLEVR